MHPICSTKFLPINKFRWIHLLIFIFIILSHILMLGLLKCGYQKFYSSCTVQCLTESSSNDNLSKIYIITPTLYTITQRAHLTRLAQTLLLVPNILWIVVEDSKGPTESVTKLLKKYNRISHVHLWIPTDVKQSPNRYRGSAQRNLALAWLRKGSKDNSNISSNNNINITFGTGSIQCQNDKICSKKLSHQIINGVGVVYFADDDNTYDIEIFEQMRYVKKVGVWPVAFCGGILVERPKVDNGKVIGWLIAYARSRTMGTDMAGFAINLELILHHKDIYFKEYNQGEILESDFLRRFVKMDDLEPLANNCTEILVWHTNTRAPNINMEKIFKDIYNFSSNHNVQL